MSFRPVFISVLSIACVALIWGWFSFQSALNECRQRQGQLDVCQRIANKIAKAKKQLHGHRFAPVNHDFSKDVQQMLDEAGIGSTSALRAGSSRNLSTDGQIVSKAVANPISEEVSLSQLVKFLLATGTGSVRYEVNSIELAASEDSAASQPEKWRVIDMSLIFIESE